MPLALPIVRGALRGRKWLPSSGGKLLRVLGGTYEPAQTARFCAVLRPGAVVFDLGAHAGYYTLLASLRVGARGRVIAFEPEPRNARQLRAHVLLNGCTNVDVIEAAVSDLEGTAAFQRGRGSGTGQLAAEGSLLVPTTTVDAFVARTGVTPAVLKIDVEGAERAVLDGAAATLAGSRPVLFLSLHGDAARRACLERLRALGYSCEPIVGAVVDRASEVLCR